MKAIYHKNYKKALEQFGEESISFVLNNEPLKDFNYSDKSIRNKTQTISHWGGYYSNPIKSIFLYQVSKLNQISSFPLLFCRDGLFCVMDFFHKHPSPLEIKTILILNFSFSTFVPVQWRGNVIFYELGQYSILNYKRLEDTSQSLILKGALLTSVRDGMDESHLILNQLASMNLNKFRKIKIFLWIRDDYFLNSNWVQDLDFSRRMNHFFPKLLNFFSKGLEVEFIDYQGLNSLKSYHQYSYMDFLPKINYISDDLTDFNLLSKGVNPYEKLEQKKISRRSFIPLSAYHGYRLIPESELEIKKIGSELPQITEIKKKLSIKSSDSLSCEFYTYLHQANKLNHSIGIKKFID